MKKSITQRSAPPTPPTSPLPFNPASTPPIPAPAPAPITLVTAPLAAPRPPAAPAAVPAPPIVAWVGLDWADKKHCLAVRTTPTGPAHIHFLEQKPARLEEFFLQLRAQHPQGRIAVAPEQSRGPVLYALLRYDFLVLYPVNPRCLADYRRAFATSGAKDDPTDADRLCELDARHADRLRPLLLEDAPTRQLRLLTEPRRAFVADRTRVTNRLTATLKCYYPLALDLVGEDLACPLALDFLGRWPNLAKHRPPNPAPCAPFSTATTAVRRRKSTRAWKPSRRPSR